uniref:VHL domain-containing protein n=1 Tax=Parastrongyloides trichosuri TaxID=131310 RepID=A0A0N4ZXI3_PARTI
MNSFIIPSFYNEKSIQSLDDGKQLEIKFFNNSGVKVILYWIDYKGDYYDFYLINPNEYFKTLSKEDNFWFARELNTGIFLEFIDIHTKKNYHTLLCSKSSINVCDQKTGLNHLYIRSREKTLYDILLLYLVEQNTNNEILPKSIKEDIEKVKKFIEEHKNNCKDYI